MSQPTVKSWWHYPREDVKHWDEVDEPRLCREMEARVPRVRVTVRPYMRKVLPFVVRWGGYVKVRSEMESSGRVDRTTGCEELWSREVYVPFESLRAD